MHCFCLINIRVCSQKASCSTEGNFKGDCQRTAFCFWWSLRFRYQILIKSALYSLYNALLSFSGLCLERWNFWVGNLYTQYSLSSFISFNSTQNVFKYSCCTNSKMIWSAWNKVKREDKKTCQEDYIRPRYKGRCWTLQVPKTSNIKFLPSTLMRYLLKRLRELKKEALVIFILIFKDLFLATSVRKRYEDQPG